MNEEEIACELRKKDLKLSKCRSKLQHLSFAFAINAYKNLDENDVQKFIKEEKKCLKLVNELKDFCAFYKIPVDFDKIYLLKEDREVVEWLKNEKRNGSAIGKIPDEGQRKQFLQDIGE